MGGQQWCCGQGWSIVVSTVMLWSRVVKSGVKSIWVICSEVGVNSEVSVDSGWSKVVSTLVSTVVCVSWVVYSGIKSNMMSYG